MCRACLCRWCTLGEPLEGCISPVFPILLVLSLATSFSTIVHLPMSGEGTGIEKGLLYFHSQAEGAAVSGHQYCLLCLPVSALLCGVFLPRGKYLSVSKMLWGLGVSVPLHPNLAFTLPSRSSCCMACGAPSYQPLLCLP